MSKVIFNADVTTPKEAVRIINSMLFEKKNDKALSLYQKHIQDKLLYREEFLKESNLNMDERLARFLVSCGEIDCIINLLKIEGIDYNFSVTSYIKYNIVDLCIDSFNTELVKKVTALDAKSILALRAERYGNHECSHMSLIAAKIGDKESLEMLKENGLRTIYLNRTISMAFSYGHFDLAESLLGERPIPASVIYSAAKHGNLEWSKKAILNGILVNSLDSKGSTALTYAIQNGHYAIVKYLIDECGAEMNLSSHDNDPLKASASSGYFDIFEFICNKLPDSPHLYFNPELLRCASRSNNVDIVKYVLSKSKFAPSGLRLALIDAFDLGYLKTAQELVRSGAHFTKNDLSNSLFNVVNAGRNLDIVEFLIELGADVNTSTTAEYTPIHFAAQNGFTKIAKLLIKHGANIFATNKYGETSLDLAVKSNKEETIKLLLAHHRMIPDHLLHEPKIKHILAEMVEDTPETEPSGESISGVIDVDLSGADAASRAGAGGSADSAESV